MNNKTAEQFYLELYNLKDRCHSSDNEQTITYKELIHFSTLYAQEFSNQQNKELIEELETERKLGLKLNSDYTDLNTRLSAELSQQKELVEKKDATIEGYKNNTAHLYDQISTLKQEIEALKKEREDLGEKLNSITHSHEGFKRRFFECRDLVEGLKIYAKRLLSYEETMIAFNVQINEPLKNVYDTSREILAQNFKPENNQTTETLSTPTTEEEKVLYTKSATVNSGDSINEEIYTCKKCKSEIGIEHEGFCPKCGNIE